MDLTGRRVRMSVRVVLALVPLVVSTLVAGADTPSLLFYVSGENGTTADYSAGGTPEPNFDSEVTRIPDGAKGAALRCGDLQRLAWWAPGNIYAQRGTLSFFWRSRYPVGPTEFPIFRVGYADHSSWDMVFLRIDYNGHGFDAFVQMLARRLDDPRWRDEWWLRYGWNRADDPPPYLANTETTVSKVEIHDAYDLKRWWWKACDGIRETTWPGVYNRSRLLGRNDYFQLPDWDCYVQSGKSITFLMPNEPGNHIEISGAAWRRMDFFKPNAANDGPVESPLFERPQGQEKTVHHFSTSRMGGKIRFTNVEQEE